MPLTPRQLRIYLLSAAAMLLIIVIGFYAYARWRLHSLGRITAQKLSTEVSRSTEGFTLSKSEAGHTLFTIHAARAIEYKQGGRAQLHDVGIIVYGKSGDRFDQISGGDFQYDPQSGEVVAAGDVEIDLEANGQGSLRPDQAPPREQKNLIHIRTRGLTFSQKTGIASTPNNVEFRLPQASGSARGAIWDSNAGILTLPAAVNMRSTGPYPSQVTAARAVLTRSPHQAVLDDAHETDAERDMRSTKVIVYLAADNRIQRMQAEDLKTIAHSAAKKNAEYHGQAANGEFFFDRQSQLRSAVLRGGVAVDSTGDQPMRGSAENARVRFANRHWAAIHAEQDVHLLQSGGGSKNAQSTELIADAFNLLADSRGVPSKGKTSGAARIEIQPAPSPGAPAGEPTVVTAGGFDASFSSQGRLKALHGEPDAKITSPAALAGQPPRVSTSDSLDAAFDSHGAVATIVQNGRVHFDDGSRQAFAQHGRYTPQDNLLTLTGAARVQQADGNTTALRMRMNRSTGDFSAEEQVKTTFVSSQPNPAGALLASGSPIHVTAPSLTGSRASGVAHYSGGARLWQDANIIQAPDMDFDHAHRVIVAQGSSAQAVTSSLVQNDSNGKQTPVNVTAARLTYADDQRRIHCEGNVVARSADGTLQADVLDIYLQPRGQANAPATPSRIEHSIAQGHVLLQQAARTGRGDRLAYTSADQKFVLTGGPARLPQVEDAQHGITRGDRLVFFRNDERVLVESAGADRALTETRIKPK